MAFYLFFYTRLLTKLALEIMEPHKPTHALPTEAELVAYEHGAAGHQGLSSNAAGDMIIKPCTQAEIDFYEAAKDHPHFQCHMPIFYGKLEQGSSNAVKAMAPLIEQGVSTPTIVTQIAAGESSAVPPAQDSTVSEPADLKEKKPEDGQSKDWTPSGGKKLSTGLAIALENATTGFKKPNVVDLKLGSRLWDDDAPEEKRQKLDQVASETTSGSLGFRVAGMKIYLGDKIERTEFEVDTTVKDGYKVFGKHYGRNLDEQTVEKALAQFLAGSRIPTTYARNKSWLDNDTATTLAKRLVRELESIEYVLEHEESRMYSASVLIVTEGDQDALQQAMEEETRLAEQEATAPDVGEEDDDDNHNEDSEDDDDDEETLGPRIMQVRLIDFAHARFVPGQGPDQNALRGIRSIITAVKSIVD